MSFQLVWNLSEKRDSGQARMTMKRVRLLVKKDLIYQKIL
jgi:hypothetical protein